MEFTSQTNNWYHVSLDTQTQKFIATATNNEKKSAQVVLQLNKPYKNSVIK